jgi:hypothetical protein
MRVLVVAIAFAMLGSARADPVPVTFLGSPGDRLIVDGIDCRTPCTLPLAPGRRPRLVTAQFGGSTRTLFTVPDRPATFDLPAYQRKFIAMIFATFAGFHALNGGVIYAFDFAAPSERLVDFEATCFALSGAAVIVAIALLATWRPRVVAGTIRVGLGGGAAATGTGFAFEF